MPEAREIYLDEEGITAGLSHFPVVDISLLGTGSGYRMDTKSASWLGVRLTKPLEQDSQTSGSAEGTMAGLVDKLKELREFNRVGIVCENGVSPRLAQLRDLSSLDKRD